MNITEFAKYAGVSKAAVSRYFNNGYLSPDKRAVIERAIKETGYAPSRKAHNARKRITKLVGVILPKLASDSIAQIMEGISSVLGENGYEMLLCNTANDYKKEVDYLDLFRKQHVDGVILLASVFTPLHKSVLSKMDIPVVIVGQSYGGFSNICHDDFGAAYMVTEHMIKNGARRFACINAPQNDKAVGKDRTDGFMSALADYGIKIEKGNRVTADFSTKSGYERAKYLLRSTPYPDALFCATDTIALGAMQYMYETGIKIPDDIMIGAVGDSKLSRVISLTSVHLHYRTAGIEAANMLMSAIYKSDHIPRSMLLGFELIERGSTKPKI